MSIATSGSDAATKAEANPGMAEAVLHDLVLDEVVEEELLDELTDELLDELEDKLLDELIDELIDEELLNAALLDDIDEPPPEPLQADSASVEIKQPV